MKRDISDTLKFLILGILIYFIIVSIPVLLFTDNKLKSELGLFLGSITGGLMALHMELMIHRSMYMEKHHSAFFVSNSIIRLFFIAAIIVVAAWTWWVNPYTLLIGMFGLKISAFFEPHFSKKYKKLKEGR